MQFGPREAVFILLLLAMPVAAYFFVFQPRATQVAEARALGADCILVIMAAIDDALAGELMAAAGASTSCWRGATVQAVSRT